MTSLKIARNIDQLMIIRFEKLYEKLSYVWTANEWIECYKIFKFLSITMCGLSRLSCTSAGYKVSLKSMHVSRPSNTSFDRLLLGRNGRRPTPSNIFNSIAIRRGAWIPCTFRSMVMSRWNSDIGRWNETNVIILDINRANLVDS